MNERDKKALIRDFQEWANWEQERGYWSNEDAVDIGKAIDEALKEGKPEIVESWRLFIQAHIEEIRCMKGLARAAYERIVADIRAGAKSA